MANEAGKNERRLAINFWDGINAIVDKGIAKPQELLHAENARSRVVGTLEKREGQTVLGTDSSGGVFVARENYDLAFVATGNEAANGLYRISGSTEGTVTPMVPPASTYTVNVFEVIIVDQESHKTQQSATVKQVFVVDNIALSDVVTTPSGFATRTISVFDIISIQDQPLVSKNGSTIFVQTLDNIALSEPPFFIMKDRNTFYIDNLDYEDANIYRMDKNERWNILTDSGSQGIAAADFSHTTLDGKVFFVNGRDYNRYIDMDGSTVVTSKVDDELGGLGDLFNSPRSRLINAYKGRLYLANYDWEGQHYGTTVLQSSTPLGILSLVNNDVSSSAERTDGPVSFFKGTLDDDLIAYYNMDDTTGSDMSNNADQVNGLPLLTNNNGVGTTDGKIRAGADFGSANLDETYSTTDTLGIDGGSISMACWVRLNTEVTPGSGVSYGFMSQGSSTADVSYEIRYQAGIVGEASVLFVRWAGNTGTGIGRQMNLGVTDFHHLIMTYDGNNIDGYIDGEFIGSIFGGGTGPGGGNADGFIVGDTIKGNAFASAVVDEVGVWNRPLTDTEIADLYNNGDGRAHGFQTFWKLPVTDTTYVYSDTFANEYEVWRVNTKIADVIVYSIDDLNIYVNDSDITWADGVDHKFLSQDQIYVHGTVTGAKVYRWPNNPTLSGQDVKQYNTFKISGGDESDLTMMVNVGNVMIVSNRSVIASWNDSVLNYYDLGIGAASRRGYVKAYGALYFLHYTGVYSTIGAMPNIISSPIQPYIDGATKSGIENAVAGKKGRSVFFCIGEVTLYKPDGSVKRVLEDVCLEYNMLQQNWYVFTNVKAKFFETFIDSSSADRIALADYDSKDVKAFLEGMNDTGDNIFFRVDTQPISIAQNLEDLSNPQTIVVESERGSLMEAFVSLDEEPYYGIEGTAEKGITRLRVHDRDDNRGEPPVAHFMSVSLRDGSKQRCKIGRAAITFVPAGVSNPP